MKKMLHKLGMCVKILNICKANQGAVLSLPATALTFVIKFCYIWKGSIIVQKLGLNEIREKYLSFFESKGHLRMQSFPLVPQNDPSLLLINAGMAPLKPYFTGRQQPPSKRVTTCQKCIRTPDIERVGKTARHGTFFEMLGNFSFGDYFKHEVTQWAWEFATKVMEMPKDRLYVTIYEDDDETYDIWTKEVGVDPSHISRMGKDDNFWEIGTGPCGPCSELYYDRGEERGCGRAGCKVGCECDRYVEFWNLVFTQFDRQEDGSYLPLEHPNIDTGMGLERLACIMQDVENIFEVDTIMDITKAVCRITGATYGRNVNTDVSLRVVTDHIRSTVFLVSDGVLPSNEGRGYVLRRLLRRAARHGKLLGVDHPFLSEVADTVIDLSKGAYPELAEKAEYIKTVIRKEEESFDQTIEAGLGILNGFIKELKLQNRDMLDGGSVFKLYDTYGFPIDLTVEILSEHNMSVDVEGFEKEMSAQRSRARKARESLDDAGWEDRLSDLLAQVPSTQFVGYNTLETQGSVILLVKDGDKAEEASAGEQVTLVLDETVFYGEGGGETGDKGIIKSSAGLVEITDCKKTPDGKYYHIGRVTEGTVRMGDTVTALVDHTDRRAVQRNHSATHLLHKALRGILGEQVGQAGSLVTPHRLRFDFTHFEAISTEELLRVEREVNRAILEAMPVRWENMPIEQAKERGATAMFGDKYGDVVRVVTMGDYSMELCGGCHVSNTAEIGLFKILSESSVASGVRRIEAVTGTGVLEELYLRHGQLTAASQALKCTIDEVPHRAENLVAELKEAEHKVNALQDKLAHNALGDLLGAAVEVNGVTVIAAKYDNMPVDRLRKLGDALKEQIPCGFFAFASAVEGKVTFVAMATKEAVAKGVHAGNIVREMAQITGGGGGGKPDSAQAGGKDASKIDAALERAMELLQQLS